MSIINKYLAWISSPGFILYKDISFLSIFLYCCNLVISIISLYII